MTEVTLGLAGECPVRVKVPPETARFLSENNLHNKGNGRHALGCEMYPWLCLNLAF